MIAKDSIYTTVSYCIKSVQLLAFNWLYAVVQVYAVGSQSISEIASRQTSSVLLTYTVLQLCPLNQLSVIAAIG